MQNLIFFLGLSSLTPTYQPMPQPQEQPLPTIFVQAVLSGSTEAIEASLKDHKKTYFDVLRVCADHDNGQAVAYALSKAIPKTPVMHPELVEFLHKKAEHEVKWLCQTVPTTNYLDHNCYSCIGDSIWLACCPFVTIADIIALLTSPSMSSEVKYHYDTYTKEHTSYKEALECYRTIYQRAESKKSYVFMQAAKEYKKKKLEHVENAFDENNS